MRTLISLLTAIQIIVYSPSIPAECESMFSQIQQPPHEVIWLDDQVAILYFPNEWHAELVVEGKMYNRSFKNFGRTRSFEAARRSANRGYEGFIAFYIRVNDDELKELKNYLLTHPGGSLSCMYGACKPVTKTTGLNIPDPIALLPLTTSIYLGLNKFLKGDLGRVQKIEFVAKNIKSFKFGGAIAAELAAALSIGSTVTIIILSILVTGDHIYQLFIPILSDSTDPINPKL